jgi:hypothetical protein
MGENNSVLKPYQKTAGVLVFLARAINLKGIITAERFTLRDIVLPQMR